MLFEQVVPVCAKKRVKFQSFGSVPKLGSLIAEPGEALLPP